MVCYADLVDSSNQIPNFDINTVTVTNGLTQWPAVNKSFTNATSINFSRNKISSIGDLSNFVGVKSFNLSYNSISKLNQDFCKLTDLNLMDLSHNLLEILNLDFFACSNSSISSLQWLYLNGNKIKSINKLDQLFVALPLMIKFDVSYNQIEALSIDSLSDGSINFLSNLNKRNSTLNQTSFANSISYLFNNNQIRSVKLNIELLYNATLKFLPISDALLLKLSSIDLNSNNIECDCSLFTDISFVLNESFIDSPFYPNLTESALFATQCSSSQRKYSMTTMMNNKKLKLCQQTTAVTIATTTNYTIPETTTNMTYTETSKTSTEISTPTTTFIDDGSATIPETTTTITSEYLTGTSKSTTTRAKLTTKPKTTTSISAQTSASETTVFVNRIKNDATLESSTKMALVNAHSQEGSSFSSLMRLFNSARSNYDLASNKKLAFSFILSLVFF
jgi:hypothetical protein